MCVIKVCVVSNGLNIGIVRDLKDGSKVNIRKNEKNMIGFCMNG